MIIILKIILLNFLQYNFFKISDFNIDGYKKNFFQILSKYRYRQYIYLFYHWNKGFNSMIKKIKI
jgi:hypothetical protein